MEQSCKWKSAVSIKQIQSSPELNEHEPRYEHGLDEQQPNELLGQSVTNQHESNDATATNDAVVLVVNVVTENDANVDDAVAVSKPNAKHANEPEHDDE